MSDRFAREPRPDRGLPWFTCLRSDSEDGVRLILTGELDLATVPRLSAALHRAQADARRVVLDLSALDFIDCSGGHLIVAADHSARGAGGQLVVVRGSAAVARFFTLTGLEPTLELFEDPPARARKDEMPA